MSEAVAPDASMPAADAVARADAARAEARAETTICDNSNKVLSDVACVVALCALVPLKVLRLSQQIEQTRLQLRRQQRSRNNWGLSPRKVFLAVAVYILSEFDPASTCAYVRQNLKRCLASRSDSQIIAFVEEHFGHKAESVGAALASVPRIRKQVVQVVAEERTYQWLRTMNEQGSAPTTFSLASVFIDQCNKLGYQPLALVQTKSV